MLTWSSNCTFTNSTGARTFKITDAKIYVLTVQLKINIYGGIRWNKYIPKVE